MNKKTIYITIAVLAAAALAWYFLWYKKKIVADAASTAPIPAQTITNQAAQVAATAPPSTAATVAAAVAPTVPKPSIFNTMPKGPGVSNIGKGNGSLMP